VAATATATVAPGFELKRSATPATCDACGGAVVRVMVGREWVVLEARELECPMQPCPVCGGTGVDEFSFELPVRGPCLRCGGEGRVGDHVPQAAVAVDRWGRARRWRRGLPRLEQEALMRRHICAEERPPPRENGSTNPPPGGEVALSIRGREAPPGR
jgi:hypothetical protein